MGEFGLVRMEKNFPSKSSRTHYNLDQLGVLVFTIPDQGLFARETIIFHPPPPAMPRCCLAITARQTNCRRNSSNSNRVATHHHQLEKKFLENRSQKRIRITK
jgi:hypothetical protein